MHMVCADGFPLPSYAPNDEEGRFEHIVRWGSFNNARRRLQWREPGVVTCPRCGNEFREASLNPWMVEHYGPVRWCKGCCFRARNGAPGRRFARAAVADPVRELGAATGVIPSLNFTFQSFPGTAPNEVRDRLFRALCEMPSLEVMERVTKTSTWFGVLKYAGVIGEDGWRSGRRVRCLANDGHLCRSWLEKSIDGWFSANEIEHLAEPHSPKDEELNPSCLIRADWRLDDGAYVECAGMMSEEAYRQKMARKSELARKLGIQLIVVTPKNVESLGKIFRPCLA